MAGQNASMEDIVENDADEEDFFFTQTQEDGDEVWESDLEDARGRNTSSASPSALGANSDTVIERSGHTKYCLSSAEKKAVHSEQNTSALRPPDGADAVISRTSPSHSFPRSISSPQKTASTCNVAALDSTRHRRHFYTFLGDKAGMDEKKRSREEVERIVHEASKNSKFFLAQQRNDLKVQERIQVMQSKLNMLSEPLRRSLEAEADRELAAAEKAYRTWRQVCVVVDLDAFFTSVEERDEPALREVPFAVGGGVISTANYEARKYGVRSAMPLFIARKLCPQLLVRSTRFEAYQTVAEQTRAIFRDYDPRYRAGSLDEAYLDLTAYVHAAVCDQGEEPPTPEEKPGTPLFAPVTALSSGFTGVEDSEGEGGAAWGAMGGDEEEEEVRERAIQEREASYWGVAERVVEEIRRRIHGVTGVTASAGIATSFCLAKMASNENKPNGQFRVGDVASFLRDAPVRKVSGIGRITERCLVAGLDVQTCFQLWANRALLYHVYTPQTARWLLCKSVGLDGGGLVDPEEGPGGQRTGRKGISRERTFAALSRKEDLLEKLRLICDSLAADMAREGLKAKNLTLKLKSSDFAVTTRAKNCAFYVSTSQELYQHALFLLLPQLPVTLRLMGVRASHFQPKPQAPPKGQGCLEAYVATGHEAAMAERPPSGSAKKVASPSSLGRPPRLGEGGSFSTGPPLIVVDADLLSPAGGGKEATRATVTKQVPVYTCPLCNQRLSVALSELNRHVDSCLRESDPYFLEKEMPEESKKGDVHRAGRKPCDAEDGATANKKSRRSENVNCSSRGGKKKKLPPARPDAKPLEHFFGSNSRRPTTM
ncbi:hypothetical protein NSK_000989 [Nannochloropsis salina CCMP1776]|uniref:DNA polymerase kappa n=1 Tax=Nannochloropsis salina CCMP1776 TaxID=1027361 RepID=A0A4D9DFT4_9STRA|nr:hypothetical protein NSK_000989 [Nannochloropsis salina CCMP1776]|eukprot:TFJ87638.1 hypothetical protein NSK_000989 [Nannochloropsis salina CCMP1776]